MAETDLHSISVPSQVKKTCSVEGCERPSRARGLCLKHYQQLPERRAYRRQWQINNVDRIRDYNQRWEAENIDRAKQTDRIYYQANKSRYRDQRRRWIANNPEREREGARRRRAANPEVYRAISDRYRLANADTLKARYKRWHQQNPAKVRERNASRRALKAAAEGSFSGAEWNDLLAKTPRCACCGHKWTKTRKPVADHRIPLSKGGSNTIDNIQCVCISCNSKKRDKLINPITGQGILL